MFCRLYNTGHGPKLNRSTSLLISLTRIYNKNIKTIQKSFKLEFFTNLEITFEFIDLKTEESHCYYVLGPGMHELYGLDRIKKTMQALNRTSIDTKWKSPSNRPMKLDLDRLTDKYQSEAGLLGSYLTYS